MSVSLFNLNDTSSKAEHGRKNLSVTIFPSILEKDLHKKYLH